VKHKGRDICLFLVAFSGALQAQKNDTATFVFVHQEMKLAELQNSVFYSRTENERFAANRDFIAMFDQMIQNPAILRYPLSKLKEVSVLESRDRQLKLITWNIYRDDGTHVYFGYVLHMSRKKIKKGFMKSEYETSYTWHKLLDRSSTVRYPETYQGTADKWFGMLYTQLVESGDYYVLIGWDGNDKLTQRKFVDVLHFRSNGDPVFGKDVFKFPRKNPKRLMFEYSSAVTMSLRYNEKRDMIIYSHLSSGQDGGSLEGQYQFYGPDGSFDALVRKKDKWVVVEDIDARNDKSKNDNAEKPDPRKQKPVFKPK
jgi:hypothetical protein